MISKSLYKFSEFSRILTGIQPTGHLTIGNYLGSIQNFVSLHKKHPHAQNILFIADLHSLTTAFDLQHAQIKYDDSIGKNTMNIAKCIISSGLSNFDNSILFVQSEIKEHAELCWLLGCIGPQHWLNMMIQYKQKSSKNSSLGIYSYPVLMSADILLYKSNFVPVGEDQKQHLELTKRYAQRFNSIVRQQFFPIPQYIPAKAPKIMSLVEPTKKMSKSDRNERSRINMSDCKDTIAQKIRRSVTDAEGNLVSYEPQRRAGLANLIRIYSSFKNIQNQQVVKQFTQSGVKEFKQALIQLISARLKQIQKNMISLSDEQTNKKLKEGAQKARCIAEKTIRQVKQLLKLHK